MHLLQYADAQDEQIDLPRPPSLIGRDVCQTDRSPAEITYHWRMELR